MTKPSRQNPQPLALPVPNLSAFTKTLRALVAAKTMPAPGATEASPASLTHVQWLNLLAKAAGFANVQALKAAAKTSAAQTSSTQTAAARRTSAAAPLPLTAMATKTAMQFDEQGRLVRWPTKYSVQRLAMWALWVPFDAKRNYTEAEVNAILKAWHTFGDHATLRRELVNMKLLGRKSDCSSYWKEPARPDAETRALLQVLRARARSA